MSDTATIPGGITPINHSNAIGAAEAFAKYYPSGVAFTAVTQNGVTSSSGPVVIALTGGSVTINGANTIDDASSGSNAITTTGPTVFFGSASDTLSAANGSTTLYGASSGLMKLTLGGPNNSVIGGSGSIIGQVSASNSTLIGGTGNTFLSVTGSNNLVVAGQTTGISGFDLSKSTGPETIATNPLGNSGKLVAFLGSGADTVIGGGGASTITAGSGADVFGFVKGYAGGSEVIAGFNTKDTIVFAGYGYSALNAPAESLTSGGDVITLTDGTTITLVGLDHKLFS